MAGRSGSAMPAAAHSRLGHRAVAKHMLVERGRLFPRAAAQLGLGARLERHDLAMAAEGGAGAHCHSTPGRPPLRRASRRHLSPIDGGEEGRLAAHAFLSPDEGESVRPYRAVGRRGWPRASVRCSTLTPHLLAGRIEQRLDIDAGGAAVAENLDLEQALALVLGERRPARSLAPATCRHDARSRRR